MYPQLIYGVADQKLNFLGYLVIDSTIDGKSSGGIRMSAEVTLDEIAALAKNMTLKCGFLGIPRGGAKAGIRVNGLLSKVERRSVFAGFGKCIGRFIKCGYYFPGTDMGTTNEDVDLLLNAALGEMKHRKHASTHVYTSWTMLVSTKVALSILGLDLEESTVAVEGFGKVGSSAAHFFSKNGARIVGISTVQGAIYNSKGLDAEKLLKMRREFGDDLVKFYKGAKKITTNELKKMPVDVLLPCAGSWTINSTNAYEVRSKIVCPGANIPITNKAEEILFKRNIIVIPDFVSNSGGILGAFIGSMLSERRKWEIIEREFGRRVSEIIRCSKERNVSPRKVAARMAMTRFNRIKASSEERNLKKQVLEVIRHIVPKAHREVIARLIAPRTFVKMLREMELLTT